MPSNSLARKSSTWSVLLSWGIVDVGARARWSVAQVGPADGVVLLQLGRVPLRAIVPASST
jgi:hypothetical protein